jgi:hypothetical protein
MAAAWHSAAETLVRDLQRVFQARLRSIVAYGSGLEGLDEPLTCLALVDSVEMADLEQCAALSPRWAKHRVATPLILPQREFARSLDAFPLEYGEIIRAHQLVFGADPFEGAAIPHEDLRRACETQIKGHLLHLREGFIEAGGDPVRVGELVTASAAAFAALLRNVARLTGHDGTPRLRSGQAADRGSVTLEGAKAADLSPSVVADILSLERAAKVPTADAARLFPDYLATVEQLAARVDQWRA